MLNRKTFVAMLFVMVATLLAVIPASAQTECTADSPCEIEAWIAFSDHRFDWAVDTANRFNELYPQFNVTMVSVADYDTIVNNYTLAREEGNYPEIVQLFDAALQFAVDTNWFDYAADIIGDREDVLGQPVNFDDIIPVIADYYTVDDVWASVAWNTSTSIGYYNMDLLNEVGITETPETWADILTACEALQPLVDNGTISACASWPMTGWFIEQWLAQQNEYMVNNENGRLERATEFNLDSDAFRAIAEFYRTLEENDYFIYEGYEQWGPTTQNFGNELVAIHISSSAGARGISEAADAAGFTLATNFMPYNQDAPGGWTGNILGGATMWVSNGLSEEVRDGAMAFLLFFSNTENSASWHTASGYVPVRQSSIDLLQDLEPGNEILWDIENQTRIDIEAEDWYAAFPNFLTASNQLGESTVNNATRGSTYGTFQQSRPIYTGVIEEYMFNGGDLDALIADAEATLNEMLEEYNFLFAE